ncbi:MAG TPA: ketopantoate reductase family protein [Casimicrobiaceae bacterium]|nr:ketopantoate reductase family protein [Casimicrobiaceae bacterium]
MRIAVMATGGVGGYFGAKLAQAGHDVSFVARGRHLAAMRERGLTVKSGGAEIRIARPTLVEDPGTLGPLDVVLFAVKLWDTESAAEAIRPLVDKGAAVVPFQNGVESIERIGAVVGPTAVLGGAAYIAATIADPGVIAHTGTMARLRFGAVIASQQRVAEALFAACKDAGIDAELSSDIRRAIWEKFAFLAAFSGMTSVARQPIGVVRADPDLRAVLEAAIREVWTLARARGVALADDFVAQQMKFADALPAEMRSSMQNDLAAGNRLEAPWLCGAVARMSEAAGLKAPVNATLYATLKPYCAGAARTN